MVRELEVSLIGNRDWFTGGNEKGNKQKKISGHFGLRGLLHSSYPQKIMLVFVCGVEKASQGVDQRRSVSRVRHGKYSGCS